MKASPLLTISAVLAAAATLAACSASADPEWATDDSTSPAGDTAQLLGELQVRDGCVVVTSETGEDWLPIFPARLVSGWRDGLMFGDALLAEGESVDLAGGELGAAASRSDFTIPAACDGLENAWVVSDGGA